MTASQVAIQAVKAAASSAGDASGNMDSAAFLIVHDGRLDIIQTYLEWAAENSRIAARKIDVALKEVKKLREGEAA